MAIKSIKLGSNTFDIDYSHCVQTTGVQIIGGEKKFKDKASFCSGIHVGINDVWDDIIGSGYNPVIYFGDYDPDSPLNEQYCAIGEEDDDLLAIVGSNGINLYGAEGINLYSSSGNVMANTSISAAGFYESSDERLKDFGEDLEPDFEKIKSIPKKYFEWKEKPEELQIGTSAQEVQKVYPELVNENKNTGYLSVDYAKLSIVALSAIDKLHEEIESLKEKIKELENGK